MKVLMAAALVVLLVGCGILTPSEPDDKPTKVFIRSQDRTVTTYELGDDGRILSSSTEDGYGSKVNRDYSYDNRNDLLSVTSRSADGNVETVYIPRKPAATSKGLVSSSAKTFVDAKGVSQDVEIKYFYTKDGKLDGMMQIDADGNIQAKAVGE